MSSFERKVIARNKKAYADFEILETVEAGIVLTGSEIKSVRNNQVNLKGSYVSVTNYFSSVGSRVFVFEAWVQNLHIAAYKYSQEKVYDPVRVRKLLLHRKEIDRLSGSQNEKGRALIPLEIYLKKGRAKLLIGLCRGKKMYDRRAELKKRSQDLEIRRALKNY